MACGQLRRLTPHFLLPLWLFVSLCCLFLFQDLHSPDFSLFVPCPNAVHMISTNTDKFLPNPKHTSPLALEMLEFVGKLMGISLRTKATLPFNFPSFVYKGLLGQPIELADLEATDAVTVKCLRAITEDSKMMGE